jgi:hypothetical protein
MGLKPGTAKGIQKIIEFRRVTDVATKRGCIAEKVRESQQWPDAYFIEPGGAKVPVEVVTAFQRLPEEDPKKGGAWMRARAEAERKADRALAETGVPQHFGAHYGTPFVVPADGMSMIPPITRAARPDEWILAAVRQKVEKSYSQPAILVVDLRWFMIPSSEDWSLGERAATEAKGKFLEIWVTDEHGDPPRRIC